jgi:hypothetical protein
MKDGKPEGFNSIKPADKKVTAFKPSTAKNSKHGIANATGVFKKWGKARPGVGKPPKNVHTKPIFSSTTANFASLNNEFSTSSPNPNESQGK